MNINENAPVKAKREIRIEATLEKVWAVLLDIDRWPSWNSTVSMARIEGAVVPGTVFRWKSGGASLVSTLQEINAPVQVCWTGRTFGIAAVHVWTLAPAGAGVVATTSESFEGLLARLIRGPFQRILERTLETTLVALKAECEHQ